MSCDEETYKRILDELVVMRAEGRETLVKVTQLQEQVKPIDDHETRLRALEHWRYGTTASFITAVAALATSAWSMFKGGTA